MLLTFNYLTYFDAWVTSPEILLIVYQCHDVYCVQCCSRVCVRMKESLLLANSWYGLLILLIWYVHILISIMHFLP